LRQGQQANIQKQKKKSFRALMSGALRSIISRSCRPSGSITRRSVHQIEKFVGSRLSRFTFNQHAQQLAAHFFARAFSSVAQQNSIKMEHASLAQPIKSNSDTRDYKYLELDNKLAVCLISDPTAEKGAAACDVNVGSFSDPEDVAGLAHFLGMRLSYFLSIIFG
jgi:hypothetical protein